MNYKITYTLLLLTKIMMLNSQEIEDYPFKSYVVKQAPPFDTFKSEYIYNKNQYLIKIENFVLDENSYVKSGYSELRYNKENQLIKKNNYNSSNDLSTYNTYEYNQFGLLIKKTYNNKNGGSGSYNLYEYDSYNKLIKTSWWGSEIGENFTLLETKKYFYVKNNITEIQEIKYEWGESISTTEKYIYENNKISKIDLYNENNNLWGFKSYVYDQNGRVKSIQYFSLNKNKEYVKGMLHQYMYYK